MQAGRGEKKNLVWMPVLTGIFLAVLVLFVGQSARAALPEPVVKGIDVSRWQGDVDWAKVKEDGVSFVMLGIGRYRDGKGIPDPKFEYNIQNALAQGIEVGVYLYSEAHNEEEARREADFVLEQIDGYRISYPVAFDIEDNIHRVMTTQQRTDITIAFFYVIEKAGYYPMIYASESWLTYSMDLSRLTKYDKWVARWKGEPVFEPVSMWQYSSTGRVAGIAGDVDLDYSYKDYTKIVAPRTTPAFRLPKETYGWRQEGKYYCYLDENGQKVTDAFRVIDGKTYYFNSNGYRVTGWKKIGGKYYYFWKTKNPGSMKTGWHKEKGNMYYLDPATGARVTGWLTVGERKYYLNKKGIVQKGWLAFGKTRYYMNPKNGRMCKGWVKIKGKYYYFRSKNGRMVQGWLKVNGKRYYMNSSGVRQTGWKRINKKWYYFHKKTGEMRKNCKIGRYRIGSDGVCKNRK